MKGNPAGSLFSARRGVLVAGMLTKPLPQGHPCASFYRRPCSSIHAPAIAVAGATVATGAAGGAAAT